MATKIYRLTNGREPLSYTIANRHTHRKSLTWYDDDLKVNRPLRFATNQRSIFADEQDGQYILKDIEFKDGTLLLDTRRDATLDLFLQHHPDFVENGGNKFELMDPDKEAQKMLEEFDLEDAATEMFKSLEIDDIERVGFLIYGNRANNMTSLELKRDVRIYAKKNPKDFIELFNDVDKNNRAMIEKAVAEKIIAFRKDDTELFWNLKDDKTMITRIKKGEDKFKAIDKFFGTKEGVEVFKLIDKLISEI